MAKPLYILGTGLSHDGSACLLKDGQVCVAIEKERLTRLKHDGFNDTLAIQYCLDAAGITMTNVSLIVQNANFGMFERGNDWFDGKRLINGDIPVVTISHHLAHAYSAFGPSPFEEAVVLVIDGCGNSFDECMDIDGAVVPNPPEIEAAHLYFEKDSYYRFLPDGRESLYKDFSPWGISVRRYPLCPPTTQHSIGGMYHAASNYVFSGMDDSGKLMGLGPYGRPEVYDFEIFDLRDGRAFVRYDWMRNFNRPVRNPGDFKTHFQYYADFALHVQKEVERALLYIVQSRYEMWPHANLCYGGGVALNAVANARILQRGPFRHLFVQPAAGDNGLALGAAYYGWLQVLKQPKAIPMRSTRFGRKYSACEIESALEDSFDRVHVTRLSNVVDDTADYLVTGKTVGWFQGRSEFGPRALGGRSILADPRSMAIRDHINTHIKFREDFRPFAPSVLLEDANLYFECDRSSPYMLFVTKTRDEWAHLIPGVVHVDGTARIQTVSRADDPLYHALLTTIKKRTGIGVLLNTSLNKRAMPIVETPEQAIQMFLLSGLDVLVLGHYLLQKQGWKAVPAMALVARLREALDHDAESALAMNLKFQFDIERVQSWTVDLRAGGPRIHEGTDGTSDITLACREAQLEALFKTPSNLFAMVDAGQLRLSGRLSAAQDVVRLISLTGAP